MVSIRLAGCVILQDRALLLLPRRDKEWYELPGGKIRRLETPREAARRETKEEIDIDVKITKELGAAEFVQDGVRYHYKWYLAQPLSGQNIQLQDTVNYYEWQYIPLRKPLQVKISPNVKNLLRLLLG